MHGADALRTRRYRLLMLYVVCCLPWIGYGAFRALQTNANSPLDWVNATFPPRAAYDGHVDRFGHGDVVVASWPGCTIDEPRLDTLLQTLRSGSDFLQEDGTPWFERVVCGREVVAKLTTGPRPVRRQDAVRRFGGTLIGPDGLQTSVVITFPPAALARRAVLVERIERAIHDVCGVADEDLHLAGPVIDGLSVDRGGRASLDRLALPSAAVVLVLACLCLGSLRAGLIVFGLSVFAQASTLALVHFAGESMSALLIVLPPLVQVLAVAGGVHLTNYYFESLPEHGERAAPWEAVRLGWLPCLLASGTTALAAGSLMASQLAPIRSFGVFAAAGVLLTAGLLLLVVPALWICWPPRRRERSASPPVSRGVLAAGVTRWMARHGHLVIDVCLVAMACGGYWLKDLRTSVRIETLFRNDSRILRDYRWLEQHVGPLVPIDMVVSWPADDDASMTAKLKQLWDIQQAATSLPHVGAGLSALQFFPALPPRDRLPPEAYDQALEQTLLASQEAFADAGFLAEEDGRQYWRVTARLSALEDVDYGAFLAQVRDAVRPVVAKAPGGERIDVQYTGIMPLVHEIQRQLMRDLFRSFLGALLLITVVMTLAQGGIRAGLVAMIPNVFPVLLLFGLLGFCGMPLDIGTVMTASVALGVSVDDTLHYLTFFQRAVQQGESRRGAVEFAYRHCGAAMIQTSAICGLGLLVFGLAEFVPSSRFAWMTSSMIAAALAGDLFLLPALLLSPLGGLFQPPAAAPVAVHHDGAAGRAMPRQGLPSK